jgi:hypothetical protein
MMRKFWLVVAGVMLSACADAAKERLKETTRPTYDHVTGRLRELTFDANANGRVDTWTDMDGAKPLRSRIDRNEDGKIDRWEHYGADGRLAKIGFSRNDGGKPDAWAFSGSDGKVQRIEISSTADESRIDRWEYYDPLRAGPDGRGALARAEEDTNRDGKRDKWETYEGGAIKTVAFDENGDGVADRRFTYAGSSVRLIESDPDASGRFATRVAVK